MKYAAVVSYHTNRFTCGVARFNKSLADELGIPLTSLRSYLDSNEDRRVLISLKFDELDLETSKRLEERLVSTKLNYDLFLHGTQDSQAESLSCLFAHQLFAASNEIADELRNARPDVKALYAPGAEVVPRYDKTDISLLTFGMAHKIRSEGYKRLGALIADDTRSFRLDVSTALHEGGTFDESFFSISEEITQSFSGQVRFLGFLADSEVSERLRTADALVAFFPKGVRENNTTVLSAMAHGCPVITNVDARSPQWMQHGVNLLDVQQLEAIPSRSELQVIGDAARVTVESYTFRALAERLSE